MLQALLDRLLRRYRSPDSGLSPLVYLANNPLSFFGLLLAVVGGVACLFTLPVHFGEGGHPYLALLAVLGLPAIFVLGLILIPLGIRRKERKQKRLGVYPSSFPKISWGNPAFRKLVIFVSTATMINVLIGGHGTNRAVRYLDSNQFCGATCHVMSPEFTASRFSAHSQVDCVECHIGEGPRDYIEAKSNGVLQLLQVVTDTYPRPVPSPVKHLAQGHLACGKCHADRDFGVKRREWIQFAEDERNSAKRTELLIEIGGGNNPRGAHGAHLSSGLRILYRSDPQREKIVWVQAISKDGRETTYALPEWNTAREDEFELREMDCVGCHNRAAHSFETPQKALDESLAAGRIDPELPSIKRLGLEILRGDYPSHEAARSEIPEALRALYQSRHPQTAGFRGDAIEEAAREIIAIYERNVFPEFKVEWGTHLNHRGHEDYPGCYRCHNDSMVSQDDRRQPIGDECSDCHQTIVLDQPVVLPALVTTTQVPGRTQLPGLIVYDTQAGPAPFDHREHVKLANNECSDCHNSLFPMAKAPLNYGADLHRAAEAGKTSCAGCHVPGGEAFGAENNCLKCHTNLTPPKPVGRPAAIEDPMPGEVIYQTSLGPSPFDHAQHVDLAKGDCTPCHNRLFPMAKAPLNYGEDLHRAAEASRTSCAGCHVAGGEAFGAEDNCAKCHTNLGTPSHAPATGQTGLPGLMSYDTKLGEATYDHAKHLEYANDDCLTCHNELFGLVRGNLNYADDIHRTAEAHQTSCGACHFEGGEAFASKGHCLDCHTGLRAAAKGSEMGLPSVVQYENRLGDVDFDHDQHILDARGDCSACHDRLFDWVKAPLNYADDHHRTAEANQASCAGCHAAGGESFASLENCDRCHLGLELREIGD